MSSLHEVALLRIYGQLEILLERLNKLALDEMIKRSIPDDVEELEESDAN